MAELRGAVTRRYCAPASVVLAVSCAFANPAAAEPPVDAAPPEKRTLEVQLPVRFELGIFGGVMFPSGSHELLEKAPHARYESPAGEIGGRFAFFPAWYAGLELEGMNAPTETDRGDAASLWAARAHVIAQKPMHGVLPFALVGIGALGATSNELGTDADPAIHFGIGAKFTLDDFLALRVDVRDTLSQRFRAQPGHQTHHPELLMGLTFLLRPTATIPTVASASAGPTP